MAEAELIRERTPEACIDVEQVAPDYEAQALETGNRPGSLLAYLLVGIFFGIVLIKSEVASWFRIQEMFRFQSFHMYGIIGSAVLVAGLSVQLIKRLHLKTIHGEPIEIQPKEWGHKGIRYWLGGTIFGLGWALLGACPGPMFALLGSGLTVMIVGLLSAMLGTWAYAALRPRLPH
ncbi:YeeE/YedE family protein [Rhodothermus profundi]|uniref:Uncharacterized protein n=1 Tax=Rhodothermus profundi TaxID=633813 RepID=A0A1M6RNX0_9BACT|nr:DUF6691 family protein [Rhodothermus profundi]SHK34124.1 hypothetical protein SAMN04488087_0916 [Rhodothermus profundi]